MIILHRFHHHRHCGVTSPFYKQTLHAKFIFEWDSWSSRDFLCELIGCWQHDNARTDFCAYTWSCSSVMAWFYSTFFWKEKPEYATNDEPKYCCLLRIFIYDLCCLDYSSMTISVFHVIRNYIFAMFCIE